MTAAGYEIAASQTNILKGLFLAMTTRRLRGNDEKTRRVNSPAK
jgi:hypothetical protein